MARNIDAKDVANHITVTVEIKRYNQWLVRLWIAKQLIKLAGFIAWVDVEFVDDIKKRREEERLKRILADFEQMIISNKENNGS